MFQLKNKQFFEWCRLGIIAKTPQRNDQCARANVDWRRNYNIFICSFSRSNNHSCTSAQHMTSVCVWLGPVSCLKFKHFKPHCLLLIFLAANKINYYFIYTILYIYMQNVASPGSSCGWNALYSLRSFTSSAFVTLTGNKETVLWQEEVGGGTRRRMTICFDWKRQQLHVLTTNKCYFFCVHSILIEANDFVRMHARNARFFVFPSSTFCEGIFIYLCFPPRSSHFTRIRFRDEPSRASSIWIPRRTGAHTKVRSMKIIKWFQG